MGARASELAARARAVRLAVFDVDGVMTDGRLWYGPSGESLKVFHVQDGHGVKMLMAAGIEVAILSGRRTRAVERRAAELGIAHVIQGAGDKLPAFRRLAAKLGVDATEAAFMGDDAPDLPVLAVCGLALSVPDAPDDVRRVAHYVTRRPGGCGAVREACELVLRLKRGGHRTQR